LEEQLKSHTQIMRTKYHDPGNESRYAMGNALTIPKISILIVVFCFAACTAQKKESQEEGLSEVDKKRIASRYQLLFNAIHAKDADGVRSALNGEANILAPLPGFDGSLSHVMCAAVECGSLKIVKLVTSKHVIDRQSFLFMPPLNLAIMQGDKDIAEHLISQGADLSKEDAWSYTPLMKSVIVGDIKTVRLIVKKFPSAINTQRYGEGRSALIHAVQGNQIEIAEYLINNGADINVKDVRGRETPLQVAERCGYREIIEIIGGASPGSDSGFGIQSDESD